MKETFSDLGKTKTQQKHDTEECSFWRRQYVLTSNERADGQTKDSSCMSLNQCCCCVSGKNISS